MSFPPAENPSPWGVPIPNSQAPYQQFVPQPPVDQQFVPQPPVDQQFVPQPPVDLQFVSQALVGDAFLRIGIEALRFKCDSLESELFNANLCREAESAMVKHLEEKARKSGEDLNRTIDDLKKEIEELKKSEGPAPIKEIGELKPVKTEAVSTDRVSELQQMNKALQKEKRALEVEVRKLETANKVNEARKVKQKKLNNLSARIVELEKEKKKANTVRNVKQKKLSAKILALQDRIRVLESKEREKTDEIDGMTNKVFELVKEKRELEAKVSQTYQEKNEEVQRILKEEEALEDERKEKILELVKRIELLKKELEAKDCQKCREKSQEVQRILEEKEALEDKRETQCSELVKCIRELEDENNELQFKVSQAMTETSEVERSFRHKKALDDYEKKGAMEDCEKKISELIGRNEVLEREKEALEAAVMKITEKCMEIEKILNEKSEVVGRFMDKKALDDCEKKGAMEDCEKKISDLVGRNEVLEREKEALEAAVMKIDSEKSKEIERILKEKMSLEADKKSMEDECMKIIEALERENNEMGAKVCQANQEKSEKVQRILNETKAVKEGYEKQISELVDRNDSLEKEKSRLEGKKKELKIEIDFLTSMLVENIQITRQMCLSNNAVTSTTPQEREGQKSAGMALSGEERINCSAAENRKEDGANSCKRKHTQAIQESKEPAGKKSKGSA